MPSLYFGIALATAALCMFSLNILLVKVASDRVSLNLGFLILVMVNLLFCGLLLGVQMAVADKGIDWSWVGTAWFVLAGVFGDRVSDTGQRLKFDGAPGGMRAFRPQ